MKHQPDSMDELRASFANRDLKNMKYNFPHGSTGIFMQVTLAVIYMYLIVISYSMLGVGGAVSVSILFLAALFAPVVYQLVIATRKKRNEEKSGHDIHVVSDVK